MWVKKGIGSKQQYHYGNLMGGTTPPRKSKLGRILIGSTLMGCGSWN